MSAFIKKWWRIVLPGTAVVLAGIAVGLFLVLRTGDGRLDGGGLQVYYFNASEGRLQGVNVNIAAGTPLTRLTAMLTRFYNPPSALVGLWPAGMPIIEMDFTGDLVGIALPPEFNELDVRESAMFRVGLTLSFTEFAFVERVLFWVVGEGEKPPLPFAEWLRDEESWDRDAIRIETRQSVTNDPTITPGAVQARVVTLYFVCAYGEGLVTETFVDEYMDIHRMPEFKLMHLIAGPEGENALRVIPSETRVRQFDYDSFTRRLYVDLSGEFSSRFIGSPQLARLMLQSIVNTLTLPANNDWRTRVDEVFFFIDSNRYEVFHGVADFHLAFTYDHDITLAEEPEYPYPYDENDGDE